MRAEGIVFHDNCGLTGPLLSLVRKFQKKNCIFMYIIQFRVKPSRNIVLMSFKRVTAN